MKLPPGSLTPSGGGEDYGSVIERGQALLGVGRCLIALGRASEAVEPLREAREAFRRTEGIGPGGGSRRPPGADDGPRRLESRPFGHGPFRRGRPALRDPQGGGPGEQRQR